MGVASREATQCDDLVRTSLPRLALKRCGAGDKRAPRAPSKSANPMSINGTMVFARPFLLCSFPEASVAVVRRQLNGRYGYLCSLPLQVGVLLRCRIHCKLAMQTQSNVACSCSDVASVAT